MDDILQRQFHSLYTDLGALVGEDFTIEGNWDHKYFPSLICKFIIRLTSVKWYSIDTRNKDELIQEFEWFQDDLSYECPDMMESFDNLKNLYLNEIQHVQKKEENMIKENACLLTLLVKQSIMKKLFW